MRTLHFIILLAFCSLAYGQENSTDIDSLVKIASSGLTEKQIVTFAKETSSLSIGPWKIPVSKNTYVKFLRQKRKFEVEFSLQNGTAVTSAEDAKVKKAWFTLAFNSKQSAKEFVRLFNKISK